MIIFILLSIKNLKNSWEVQPMNIANNNFYQKIKELKLLEQEQDNITNEHRTNKTTNTKIQ